MREMAGKREEVGGFRMVTEGRLEEEGYESCLGETGRRKRGLKNLVKEICNHYTRANKQKQN